MKPRKPQPRPLTEADLSAHDRNEVARFKDLLQRTADGTPKHKAYVLVYGDIGAPREPKNGES